MKRKLLWILTVILILLVGLWVTVYILEKKGRDYYYEGGTLTIYGYDNGELLTYKNFKMANGEYISYYKNGQVRHVENFKDGKIDGEFLSYDENGKIRIKWNFKNGEINGEQILYFENGGISFMCNYLHGVENGLCVSYYENGQIEEEKFYDNGELIQSKHYDENGTLVE